MLCRRHAAGLFAWFLVACSTTGQTPSDAGAAQPDAAQPDAAVPVVCNDEDGDRYGAGCDAGADCDDTVASIHLGSVESCNGVDDTCDSATDEGCTNPCANDCGEDVPLPAGQSYQGALPNEGFAPIDEPRRTVTLSAFRLDRYEVTNGLYKRCVAAGMCTPPNDLTSETRADYYEDAAYDDYPVISVTHAQAERFCAWAGKRLPTEAEYERAVRGLIPSDRDYPWGDAEPDCNVTTFGALCVSDTQPVGSYPTGATPEGIHDLAGNAWEWMHDWYRGSPGRDGDAVNPQGPLTGETHVIKGSSWTFSTPGYYRATSRFNVADGAYSYFHDRFVGFRCAR
ncbi:MAG: SUMF1/EgtB/PvdO family nonheme iron enzyme [Myxococcota bacterium]